MVLLTKIAVFILLPSLILYIFWITYESFKNRNYISEENSEIKNKESHDPYDLV